MSPVSYVHNSLIFFSYAATRSLGCRMTAISRKTRAGGLGLTMRGLLILGVAGATGEGALDVPGVPGDIPFLAKDLIESDDGVRGSAENRFKLLMVALNGLLLLLPLDSVRTSSRAGLLVPFGGRGGKGGESTGGEGVWLGISSMRCALPFGDDAMFDSRKLTQLVSRRSSSAGRRAGLLSVSDSCSTTGNLTSVGDVGKPVSGVCF